MRILRAADYRRMPWKNGGGETAEIAVWPEDSGLDDFGWRVSMARVERDGPFSAFPGVDRTLSILEGEGLRLAIAGSPAIELDGVTAPYSFPADQPTDSALLGGPVTDLNVMTRRGRFKHAMRRVEVLEKTEVANDAKVTMLLCHRGTIDVTAGREIGRLGELDCLILEGSVAGVSVTAQETASLFLIDIYEAG
jgi:environmental stress-induced protein Ves